MADFVTFCLDAEVDAVKRFDKESGRVFVTVHGPFATGELQILYVPDPTDADPAPGPLPVAAMSRNGRKMAVQSRTP
jgi:hypothetical protein